MYSTIVAKVDRPEKRTSQQGIDYIKFSMIYGRTMYTQTIFEKTTDFHSEDKKLVHNPLYDIVVTLQDGDYFCGYFYISAKPSDKGGFVIMPILKNLKVVDASEAALYEDLTRIA